MKPLQAYRCPVCGRYFDTEGAFYDHADGCSAKDGNGFIGRILRRDDRNSLEVFIPRKNTAGYLEGAYIRFESEDPRNVTLTICNHGFPSEDMDTFTVSDAKGVRDSCDCWMESVSELIGDFLGGEE